MKKILTVLLIAIAMGAACAVSAEEIVLTQRETYIKQIIEKDYKFTSSGLFRAIRKGDTASVALFLKAGIDPNSTYMKMPALYFAIYSSNPKAVDLLVQAGANPDKEFAGQTPLTYAIGRKSPEVVNMLIKDGADVNKQSSRCDYPINYAVKKKNETIVKSLIVAGATPNEDTLLKALKSKNETIKNLVLKTYKNL